MLFIKTAVKNEYNWFVGWKYSKKISRFFSMKNSCIGIMTANWIKILQNLSIWSHFESIKIDIFEKIFELPKILRIFGIFLKEWVP